MGQDTNFQCQSESKPLGGGRSQEGVEFVEVFQPHRSCKCGIYVQVAMRCVFNMCMSMCVCIIFMCR